MKVIDEDKRIGVVCSSDLDAWARIMDHKPSEKEVKIMLQWQRKKNFPSVLVRWEDGSISLVRPDQISLLN
ncbi:MAG: hypothetical protein QW835_00695 [Candidatus Hadarchaeum sp.]